MTARVTPPWKDVALPRASRDPARLFDDLQRFGYCLIAAALSGEALAATQERLFAQAAAERRLHALKNPANPDPASQWIGMLLNKGDLFFDLVEHPLYCRLVEQTIGTDHLVSCVDAQVLHPGAGAMALHCDQWWMPQPVPAAAPNPRVSEARRGTGTSLDPRPAAQPIAPAVAVNAMWMITDFTDANGATRIVPGSHLSGAQPDASVPHRVPSVAATGPAGSAMVFDARLWHGAGANRSDQPRFGITTVSCCPQMRPLENYTRGLRPEVLARCGPARLRRLGFVPWFELRPHRRPRRHRRRERCPGPRHPAPASMTRQPARRSRILNFFKGVRPYLLKFYHINN